MEHWSGKLKVAKKFQKLHVPLLLDTTDVGRKSSNTLVAPSVPLPSPTLALTPTLPRLL
jgi:hypothetical protein